MHTPKRTGRPWLIALAGGALLASAILSACGATNSSSSSESDSAATAAAQKVVDDHMDSPAFVAPPKLDVAKAKGKRVWYIADLQEGPIVMQWQQAFVRGMKAAGVTVTTSDPGNSVPRHADQINQALAANVDAIVIADGFPASLFSAQVAEAKKKGIAFISTVSGDPRNPPDVPGLTADVTYDYPLAGKLIADWFIADSKGAGTALLLNRSDLPSSVAEIKGMKDEIKSMCPKCSYTVSDVTADTFQSQVPTLTQSAVQRDPDLRYILPTFDSMALYVVSALKQAGVDDQVKVAAFNATTDMMTSMKSGSSMVMDLGGPNDWFAGAIADTTLRVLVGAEPVQDPQVGYRMFTHENTQSLNTKVEDDKQWYGTDYLAAYLKAWGL